MISKEGRHTNRAEEEMALQENSREAQTKQVLVWSSQTSHKQINFHFHHQVEEESWVVAEVLEE
jgi:mannose-6-phosphate isomerase-like protein (cupin superfamily)